MSIISATSIQGKWIRKRRDFARNAIIIYFFPQNNDCISMKLGDFIHKL